MNENKLTREEKLFASMTLFLYKKNVLTETTYQYICMLYVDLVKQDEFHNKRIQARQNIQNMMKKSCKWWCIYRMLINQEKNSKKNNSKSLVKKFQRKNSRLRHVSF